MVEKTCWSGSQPLSHYVICRAAEERRKRIGQVCATEKRYDGRPTEDSSPYRSSIKRVQSSARYYGDQSVFIHPTFHRLRWNDDSLVRQLEFTWDMVFLEMSALLQKGA